MAVSIITFANLGRKKNLKTVDILPVIKIFIKTDQLAQIICQINTKFSFISTVSAVPSIIRYSVRIFEKLSGHTLSRMSMEHMFDFFAQFRLKKNDVTVSHGGYFLYRTLKKAKEYKSILVDIPVSAHIGFNAQLEQEEFKILGIENYKGLYTHLYRNTKPINFDYLITMSEFARQSYIKMGFPKDSIFVAIPDVDTKRFSPTTIKKNFNVLFIAHTQPLKGFHYLLDAWQTLTIPHAKLTIVGDFVAMPQSLKESYERRIQGMQNITWIKDVDYPENFYREASIFVFPSLTEGFGRVTLEAMACGLPVITTQNAQGIVEDGKTGFVVPIRDSKALKEKIEYFYQNSDVIERMGKEARIAVESKKPFGESIFEIYQEILRKEHKI